MSLVSEIKQVREKFGKVRKALQSVVIGQDQMIEALLLGLVAGEHVVVIGPPGTAKSYTVRCLCQLIQANYFQYLMTRFTDFSELFGTLDVTELAKGNVVRKWSKIVEADIIFLDEIFKASSAILNALLSLLQERVVYDPFTGQAVQTRLHMAVGASNEVPQEEELRALYDRFSIRVFVDYLNNDDLIMKAIEMKWVNNGTKLTPVMTMDEVRKANELAIKLLKARVKGLDSVWKIFSVQVIPMVKELRSKGIIVSDRTLIEKLPKLFAAYLVLYGVTQDSLFNAPYKLIPLLASDKSQLQEIQKVLNDSLGPLAEVADTIDKAKQLMSALKLDEAEKVLNTVLSMQGEILKTIQNRPWLKPRAEALMKICRELLQQISDIKSRIQKEVKKGLEEFAEGSKDGGAQ